MRLEHEKNMYMCGYVYVYTHTRGLYETDSFILVFNQIMVFQVETCS